MTAVPASARPTIVAFMRRMPTGSSPVRGSSSSSAFGRCRSPQAMSSFCFIPRESSPGSASRFPSSSTSSSRSRDPLLRVGDLVESSDEAEVLLDGEVLEEVGLVRHQRQQRFGRHRVGRPCRGRHRIRPRVGRRIPATLRIVVVFPAPFGPTSPSTSPGATWNDRPWTAANSPYTFSRPSTSITGVPPGVPSRGGTGETFAGAKTSLLGTYSSRRDSSRRHTRSERMRNYWIRILIGALVIFAVGMLGVTLVRNGMVQVNDVVRGSGPISIPLAIIPFEIGGHKLGTLERVVLERTAPKNISSVKLEVKLDDSLVAQGLGACRLAANLDASHEGHAGLNVKAGSGTSGTFRCLDGDADTTMVEFGHAMFQPGGVDVPLFLPHELVDQLKQGTFLSDSSEVSDSITEAMEALRTRSAEADGSPRPTRWTSGTNATRRFAASGRAQARWTRSSRRHFDWRTRSSPLA